MWLSPVSDPAYKNNLKKKKTQVSIITLGRTRESDPFHFLILELCQFFPSYSVMESNSMVNPTSPVRVAKSQIGFVITTLLNMQKRTGQKK